MYPVRSEQIPNHLHQLLELEMEES
jgi:hypothetical protein